jgi:hypothetical protein
MAALRSGRASESSVDTHKNPPPLAPAAPPSRRLLLPASHPPCCAAVGAGILSLPFAFRAAGWAGGLLATFGVAAIESFTLYVLARYAEVTGSATYSDLVSEVAGSCRRLGPPLGAGAGLWACHTQVFSSAGPPAASWANHLPAARRVHLALAQHPPPCCPAPLSSQVRKMLGKKASLAMSAVLLVYSYGSGGTRLD